MWHANVDESASNYTASESANQLPQQQQQQQHFQPNTYNYHHTGRQQQQDMAYNANNNNNNNNNMTDYVSLANANNVAMANLNLVNYMPSGGGMAQNSVAQQQQLQQQQQQQQQQQPLQQQQYSIAGGGGSMPLAHLQNVPTSVSNATNQTSNPHLQMALPPGMAAVAYMPTQNAVQNSGAVALNPAAYYATTLNSYQMPSAAQQQPMTAGFQLQHAAAGFAPQTPQPTLMPFGNVLNVSNGGAGAGNLGSLTQSTAPISIANPHNDFAWAARDAFPLRLLVNRELVGQVIGKEGKNIKQIQQNSGTRIDVDRVTEIYSTNADTNELLNERKVIIHGDLKQCSAACRSLLIMLLPETVQPAEALQQQVVLRMVAPNALVGRIIGKRGAIIKQISQETRTKINIHDNGIYDPLGTLADRIVSISGTLDDVCLCESQVSERLNAGFEEFGGLDGIYATMQGIGGQNAVNANTFANTAALLNSFAAGGASNSYGNAFGSGGGQNFTLLQQQAAALLLRGMPMSPFYDPNNAYNLQNSLLGGGGGGRSASSMSSAGSTSSYGGRGGGGYNNNNNNRQYGKLSPVGGGSGGGSSGGGYGGGQRTQMYQNQLAERSRGLEYTYMFVPATSVGAILGHRGANIQQCKATSGANLAVAPDAEDLGDFKDTSIAGKPVQDWRRVTIRGPPDAQYRAQYCLFQSVGNDAGLLPQQLAEIKLRIDIPVPRIAIGRIIGKGGSTVKDIQRIGQVRLVIPDLPAPYPSSSSAANSNSNDNTTTGQRSREKDVASAASTSSRSSNVVPVKKEAGKASTADGSNKPSQQQQQQEETNEAVVEDGAAKADGEPRKELDANSPDSLQSPTPAGDSENVADTKSRDNNKVADSSSKQGDEIGSGDAAAAATTTTSSVSPRRSPTALVKTNSGGNSTTNTEKTAPQQAQGSESASGNGNDNKTPAAAAAAATSDAVGKSAAATVSHSQSSSMSNYRSSGAGGSGGPKGSSFNTGGSSSNNSNTNYSSNSQSGSGGGRHYGGGRFGNNSYESRGRSALERDHDSYYHHRSDANMALMQITGSFGACQYAQDQVRNYVQAVLVSQIQHDEQSYYYEKQQRYNARERGGGASGGRRPPQNPQPQPPTSAASTAVSSATPTATSATDDVPQPPLPSADHDDEPQQQQKQEQEPSVASEAATKQVADEPLSSQPETNTTTTLPTTTTTVA